MKRILIAEDDPIIGKLFVEVLSDEGCEIILVTDGEGAIDNIKNTRYDLIILDLLMPKRNGFEVLEFMKQNKEYLQTPVIVTSNLSTPEDESKALKLGAREYIIKSDISITGLTDKVESLLGK